MDRDFEPELVRASDLRQYLYCPRVVFYHLWLPGAGVATEAMREGTIDEERLRTLEKRRRLKRYGLSEGRRAFRLSLLAPALGLTGTLDMLIEAGGGLYPVEFKGSIRPGEGHELQVAAYAMMLEETKNRRVERGFIYLLGAGAVVTVVVSKAVRRKIISTISAVRAILHSGIAPEPTRRRVRCRGCEYRHFCGDVYEAESPGSLQTEPSCAEIRQPEF